MPETKSEVIMYNTKDGLTKIEATFDQETVWLSLHQIPAEIIEMEEDT